MNLQTILEKHKLLKFPHFPEDDDFADWFTELIELDSYYYGAAESALKCNKTFFFDLKLRLSDYSELKKDAQVYQECYDYLKSLEEVINAMGTERHNKKRKR